MVVIRITKNRTRESCVAIWITNFSMVLPLRPTPSSHEGGETGGCLFTEGNAGCMADELLNDVRIS
ncbi:hypothetical protein THF5H11_30417 [Vibrio jasicida]|nr:hypothetical protein THF5H11_30417 [Vibrio jasicida]CAH1604214.1 hypothetical protein THF5G08_10103 [Vibrio jasicida]